MCEEGRVRQTCMAGATRRMPGWVSPRPGPSVPTCVCMCLRRSVRVEHGACRLSEPQGTSESFIHPLIHSFHK